MTCTRDELLDRLKKGESLERLSVAGIDLSNAVLSRANLNRGDLEGANLEGSRLANADLRSANLREAHLVGADLKGANLEGADLEGARLSGANLSGANLARANLSGADLEDANLSGARLHYAQLESVNLARADLSEAVATHAEFEDAYLGGVKACKAELSDTNLRRSTWEEADLTGASLLKADAHTAKMRRANLSGADLRYASFRAADLGDTTVTGACIAGVVGTGAPIPGLTAEWADGSPDADGSRRVSKRAVAELLGGEPKPVTLKPTRSGPPRYFGVGDELSGATLRFRPNSAVQIDSILQDCTIELGEGVDLTVGPSGVLANCCITGPGSVSVAGKFFEGSSTGLVGLRRVVVRAGAQVVSEIVQHQDKTRFAFERGCAVRIKIRQEKK